MNTSYPDDDKEFLKRLNAVITDNLTKENLSVAFLAGCMCMSLSTFFRHVKSATGMGGNEYIRSVRIENAIGMLQNANRGGVTVAIGEVAFACGFTSLSSFDKSFRKKFGISPTEYMKKCGMMSDGEAAESPWWA